MLSRAKIKGVVCWYIEIILQNVTISGIVWCCMKVQYYFQCISLSKCCCCSCSRKEFFGAVQIVAPFEDTCVEIYKVDGDKYDKILDRYLNGKFVAFTYTSPFRRDLSGYFINSSKPIAVYAGHACAFVPDVPLTFFCDHVVEQIPPVSELGKLHIVPPIAGRDPNAGYVQISDRSIFLLYQKCLAELYDKLNCVRWEMDTPKNEKTD